jgi:hypothetical protein
MAADPDEQSVICRDHNRPIVFTTLGNLKAHFSTKHHRGDREKHKDGLRPCIRCDERVDVNEYPNHLAEHWRRRTKRRTPASVEHEHERENEHGDNAVDRDDSLSGKEATDVAGSAGADQKDFRDMDCSEDDDDTDEGGMDMNVNTSDSKVAPPLLDDALSFHGAEESVSESDGDSVGSADAAPGTFASLKSLSTVVGHHITTHVLAASADDGGEASIAPQIPQGEHDPINLAQRATEFLDWNSEISELERDALEFAFRLQGSGVSDEDFATLVSSRFIRQAPGSGLLPKDQKAFRQEVSGRAMD